MDLLVMENLGEERFMSAPRPFIACVALLIALVFAIRPVSASLIGDTITITSKSNSSTYDTKTGIAGTDNLTVTGYFTSINLGDDYFVPSFTGDTITITYSTTFPASSTYDIGERLEFSGLDWAGARQLVGVTLQSTTVDLLGAGNVFLSGPDQVTLNLGPGTWLNGDTVVLLLESRPKDVTVPEPATAALGLMGLASVALRRRRAA